MTAKTKRRILLGQETTPGDQVTPEIALRVTDFSFKPNAEKIVVDENIGSYAPARSYLGALSGEGSLSLDGTYQQAPYVVSMALGDLAPTGSDPYTWLFTLPDAAARDFATYTLEYTDGGSWIVRCTGVFATTLTISGEFKKSWMFDADLVGQTVSYQTSLLDPLLPTDPTVNTIKMATTQLWIDDAYADIGSTEVEDALISFNWKLENYQHAKQFAGSLYPQGRGNDRWQVTLELILEVANAVALSQRANLLTDVTQSAIRLQSTITPFTGIDWYAAIDGNYMLDDVDTLDDRDGNNIVKMTYRGEMDDSGNTGVVKFINDLSDLSVGGYWYD